MEGWDDLGGWVDIDMVNQTADSHPSGSNWAQCTAILLIDTNMFTTIAHCHLVADEIYIHFAFIYLFCCNIFFSKLAQLK